MSKKEKILKLAGVKTYQRKYTLQEIANRVGCTRQYVGEVLGETKSENPRESEKVVAHKLRSKGFKVKYMPYNHKYDLLVGGKLRVEVKHRTGRNTKVVSTGALYKNNFDLVIFVVGELNKTPCYYFVPSSDIPSNGYHLTFPVNPVRKNQRQQLYSERWDYVQAGLTNAGK